MKKKVPEGTVKKRSKADNFKGRGKATQFSKENQPPPESKSKGWADKKFGQELAREVLRLPFKGAAGSELKKKACDYFGVDEKDLTVEMMMQFRQVEKAIQKADTNAFRAVQERAYGHPKQFIDHTSKGEKIPPITGMVIKEPKRKNAS